MTPAAIAEALPGISLVPVDGATWEVRDKDTAAGFIHVAGTVFVSLAGRTIHRAVEVGQSLSLGRAVEMLRAVTPAVD